MSQHDTAAGFEEFAHTADWALHVWAPDYTGLLAEAARGMYGLMGMQFAAGPLVERRFELDGIDREGLLVAFLEELLYYCEQHEEGFERLELRLNAGRLLMVEACGRKIAVLSKEIKAVTFHQLVILETPEGLETTIVFDV